MGQDDTASDYVEMVQTLPVRTGWSMPPLCVLSTLPRVRGTLKVILAHLERTLSHLLVTNAVVFVTL